MFGKSLVSLRCKQLFFKRIKKTEMNLSKEDFLAEAEKYYEALHTNLDSNTQSFYDYESMFVQLNQSFAQNILEKSVGQKTKKERKKKVKTSLGDIELAQSHQYSSAVHGYRISPFLQERVAYLGQSEIYKHSTDLIKRFLNIEINDMQVHRVTNTQGALATKMVDEAAAETLKASVKPSAVVYAQFDGSMVFTREDAWQEVKVGRIFSSDQILKLSDNRSEIKGSLYTAHLGKKDAFLEKFEPLTDIFDNLDNRFVFITDGAPWMHTWITDSYPKATHILDIFHALEHINKWLGWYEKCDVQRAVWQKMYKKILIEQGGTAVYSAIAALKPKTKTAIAEQILLLKYLKKNELRMDYPAYLTQNLYIGSGAIEAAQRTVVQQRLKLSGQRWTEVGAQNVLNLRTVNMSGLWYKVVDNIRNYANVA